MCVIFFYQVTSIFHLRGGEIQKKNLGPTYSTQLSICDVMIMEELYYTLLFYVFSLLELLPRFERAPLPARTPAGFFNSRLLFIMKTKKYEDL